MVTLTLTPKRSTLPRTMQVDDLQPHQAVLTKLWQFPRARVFMDELNLKISRPCAQALEELADMVDKPLEPGEEQAIRKLRAERALVRFHEHFGKSAKRRCVGSKLVSLHDHFRARLRDTVLAWRAASEHEIGQRHLFRQRDRQGRCPQSRRGSELLVNVCVGLGRVCT